ncbi:MAG: hypothetical protein LBH41_00880 [Rickettsiales bacterium]|nr:hypothetical protein [Rickettsiales bacterium]
MRAASEWRKPSVETTAAKRLSTHAENYRRGIEVELRAASGRQRGKAEEEERYRRSDEATERRHIMHVISTAHYTAFALNRNAAYKRH